MANTHVLIPRASFGTDLATALTTKYGANATVHFSDATTVVFSCTDISNKVIKVVKEQFYSSATEMFDRLSVYIGDTWSTGSTITNPFQFSGDSVSSSSIDYIAYILNANVILGDTFMIIYFDTLIPQMAIIGKLTNDQYAVFGYTTRTAYSSLCHGYITDGVMNEAKIETMYGTFTDDTKYVVQPIVISRGGMVVKNADNSYATITGILNTCSTSTALTANDTIFVTRSRYWYTFDNSPQIATSLLCVVG